MLISITKNFSGITKFLRGETVSRADSLPQGTLKSFPPELAQAMERSARRAEEESIDIEEPIEGDVGL